jgi:hypothetical protein
MTLVRQRRCIMAFGKRTSVWGGATSTPSPPQKIIPDEAWQGKAGNLLCMIGMSPDDASNLVPTWDTVNARIARDKAAHEARWAQVNRDIAARTGDGAVRPFFLIPDACWNDEKAGHFLLMTLELSPYEDWNVAFLPADRRTAEALNLPLHPNGDVPWILADSMTFMSNAMARFEQIYAEAGRTREFARFKDQKDDIKDKVRALAVHILTTLGEDWERARAG